MAAGGALDPLQLLNALPQPLLAIDASGAIREVNTAAEHFFDSGRSALLRSKLADFLPFGSPVIDLVADAIATQATVNGYKLDVSTPRTGLGRVVDAYVAPLPRAEDGVLLLLQERSIAEKMDRQLTHRSAARSVTALGAMLAHEIKNPLSGIRGAAQLLEASVCDEDRALTRLICEETDRIVKLVDRMEVVLRRAAGRAREPQHPFGARPREAARAGGLRPAHPLRRGLRPVAAACARLARRADPGLPQPGQERRGSHWRRKHRRRDHSDDRLPARACG